MNPHTRLGTAFLKSHAAAAARILEDFPAEQVGRHLAAQNLTAAGQVFENLSPGFAAACLATLDAASASRLFTTLNPDFQILTLRQFDRDRREALLGELEPERAYLLRRRLPYTTGTAGAIMEAPLASVPESLTVRNAIKRIKRLRRGMKFYVYATNTSGQLTGVLTLHELLVAPSSRSVAQVMLRHVISLSPVQPLHSVIDSPYWKDYHALPVVDGHGTLLGVIRQKGLRRFQEQLNRDVALGSGLGTLVSVTEQFALTAGQLLDALIASGRGLTRGDHHG
jgi:magnesium transporter